MQLKKELIQQIQSIIAAAKELGLEGNEKEFEKAMDVLVKKKSKR